MISPVTRGAGRKGGHTSQRSVVGKGSWGMKRSLEDEVRLRPFKGGTVFRMQMEWQLSDRLC